jgi:glycosyltransferase involved in cell wall biosynthesis
VIAVSQHTASHIVRVEGAPPGKVVAVPNGVDFSRFRPSSTETCLRLRKEFGAESADLIIVPARLHPEKGHAVLFDALPLLRSALRRSFVVVLAGTGPFEEAYRSQVVASGCSDVVRFAGFRSDLPDLIQTADVVVLPSVAEAFGFVLVEALFLGAAIVATTAGGIPEIIDHGVDGVLVAPGESQELGRAIAQVLTDEGLRARLSQPGRAKALKYFGADRMVRRYEQVYADILAGHR